MSGFDYKKCVDNFEEVVRNHPLLKAVRTQCVMEHIDQATETKMMVLLLSIEREELMKKNVEMALHMPPSFFRDRQAEKN